MATTPKLSPIVDADNDTERLTTKENIDNEGNNDDDDAELQLNKTLYMCVYILSMAYYGVCLSLSDAIYVELKEQLNTESSTIAYVLPVRQISFVFGGLTGAFVIDRYKETHKFFAGAVFCSGVALSVIPFATSTELMFFLWVPIGFAMGCAELSNSVYIFRLFPKKGGARMLLLSVAMYHFGKLSALLIVQGSIECFGSYRASMFLFSFIALCYACIVPWLKTPPYDKLRALKREVVDALALETENGTKTKKEYKQVPNASLPDTPTASANDLHASLDEFVTIVAEKLATDKKYKYKQYFIITLLIVCYALFSMIKNGFTTFITIYGSEYLEIDDSMERYLFVTFYLGQFIVAIIGSSIKQLNPIKSVLASFGCFLVCTLIFIIFPQEIIAVFIAFALTGFCGGVTYPFLYAWCELIRPLTGILSCLFILAYGCGDAVISEVIKLINSCGPGYYAIIPIPLLVCAVIACATCIVNSIIYMKYKKYEHSILTEVENDFKAKNGATFQPTVNQVEPPSYNNPTPKQKNMRNIATSIGFLAFVLLIIAMAAGQMATGGDVECTFIGIMDGFYYDDFWYYDCYYSSLCDGPDVICDHEVNSDTDDWCGTHKGVNSFITMTVFSFLFLIPAIIIGQPWCFVKRCWCCKFISHNYYICSVMPKLFYGICTFLSLMAILLWYAQDKICTQQLGLGPGISPIMVIINTVLVFIAAIIVS